MAAPLLIVVILGAAAWCAVSPGLFGLFGWAGPGEAGRLFTGVFVPWLGLAALLLGLVFRLCRLLRAPLAGNACLAEGQGRSLSWVRPGGLSAPGTPGEARLRRWRNLFSFRPLRRASRLLAAPETNQPVHYPSGWLRLGAWLFHFSLFLVILRHIWLWLTPFPTPLAWLDQGLDWAIGAGGLDGFFLFNGRPLFLTDIILPASLLFLLGRRRLNPTLRRISRPADYFALFLLLALCGSGLALRYGTEADPAAVRDFFRGLASFSPAFPPEGSPGLPRVLFLHLFFFGLLLLFIPFSKLGHMGTAWLAPIWSRPLVPACSLKRVGSWRRRARVTTGLAPAQSYAEYAAAYGTALREAGIPVGQPESGADETAQGTE